MSTVLIRKRGRSVRVERRTLVLSAVLVGVMLGLGLLGLCFGAAWATPGEVFAALAGYGDSTVVIRDWRLPRVLGALVFGAALGIAGSIFQNLTRNPLGSPDIIGLDAGAYTGALFAITLLSATATQLAIGSVIGGLCTAAVIYALSYKGGLSGLRLVVIGIAMNAMLTALNNWIELRVELEVAMVGAAWHAGSLNGIGWDDIGVAFGVIAVLFVVIAMASPGMHQAALGDSLAKATGVRLDPLRLVMVVVGVGCTAAVTAVTGPIVFIALAAPQIGRRLAKAPGVPLLPAALTGAVLLLAADLIAQLLLAPVSLPVGAVTAAIGGAYLIWLLTQEVRR